MALRSASLNVGVSVPTNLFLVLTPIDWSSPANILEKIIRYEAVHEIGDWNELRRRLDPEDRRCFAFFHPQLPDEPIIFIEVALTRGMSAHVQPLLRDFGVDVTQRGILIARNTLGINRAAENVGRANVYFLPRNPDDLADEESSHSAVIARRPFGRSVTQATIEERIERAHRLGKIFRGKPAPLMRQVGAEAAVPVIDLHAMTIAFYEALGPERSPLRERIVVARKRLPPSSDPSPCVTILEPGANPKRGAYGAWLVVVAIIGIVSLVSVPNFMSMYRAQKIKTSIRLVSNDLRQARVAKPFVELYQSILVLLRVVIRLNRGCCRAEQNFCVMELRHNHGHVSRMIAGSRFLLFVRSIMLLVYDDGARGTRWAVSTCPRPPPESPCATPSC